MEITKKTKIKNLIPPGYEYNGGDVALVYDEGKFGFIQIEIQQKRKTLEYYTGKLFDNGEFYQWLKEVHPKQYYSIILEMIAKDICERLLASHYYLQANGDIFEVKADGHIPVGTIVFDTEENAKYAQKLLGENIKHLL
jgi:hypothetical protein